MIILVSIDIALKNFSKSNISTILNSSTIMTSASIGLYSFLPHCNSPSNGLYSSILWIVLAFIEVVSVILLAAFPVGATNSSLVSGFFLKIAFIIPFNVVVFPVPGPPVIISIFSQRLSIIAFFCCSSYFILFSLSIFSISFFTLSVCVFSSFSLILLIFFATYLSA